MMSVAARMGLTGVQRRQLSTFLTGMAYLLPSIILFASFVFIPLVRTFILSTYLTDPIGRQTVFAGSLYYERLINQEAFFNSFTRTLLFTIYTVPTTIIFSLVLALLANLRLKGIAVFRIIFSSTIAISGATASLMFMYIYHPGVGTMNYFLGLLNIPDVPWLTSDATALGAVAITSVWLQLGLNTVILLAAMQGIPEELYESAMIDGANSWNKFLHITLAFLSSTFFFLLVVDTLASFQTFTLIEVMTSGGPIESTNLLVYAIYRVFYFDGKYGYAAAQSVMLFFIMLVLTIIQFVFVEKKVYYE